MAPLLLLDANAIFAGIVGSADGPSALLLASMRLGGLEGCTVENAMEEARRRLLYHFNRSRLKASPQEADRELKSLRECPTFTVHPWVNADPQLFPGDPDDAYLLKAIELYRPDFLLTWDKALLDLDVHGEAVIATPALLLHTIDVIERPE